MPKNLAVEKFKATFGAFSRRRAGKKSFCIQPKAGEKKNNAFFMKSHKNLSKHAALKSDFSNLVENYTRNTWFYPRKCVLWRVESHTDKFRSTGIALKILLK